jgi:hypothetical protein
VSLPQRSKLAAKSFFLHGKFTAQLPRLSLRLFLKTLPRVCRDYIRKFSTLCHRQDLTSDFISHNQVI